MIVLYIIGAILLLILLLLFLPVSAHIKFVDDFFLKIKFAGIKVFEIEPKEAEEKKPQSSDTVSDKKAENAAVSEGKKLFSLLKEKYGFLGAVKSVFGFLENVFAHIKKLLKHIKICRVKVKLVVAGEDAAQTAVEYGAVCSAAYPVLAMLDSCAGIGIKNIDIRSDFTSQKPEFGFSAVIVTRIFFMLIAAYRIYKEYTHYKGELQ